MCVSVCICVYVCLCACTCIFVCIMFSSYMYVYTYVIGAYVKVCGNASSRALSMFANYDIILFKAHQ